MKTLELRHKRVVLTGANGFLGQVIDRMLTEEGVHVFGTDISISEWNQPLDISSSSGVDEFCTMFKVSEQKIDGVVNNAALSFKKLHISDEQFDKTLAVNIKGTNNMITKLRPFMNKGASIVNVSSIFGSRVPEFSNYDGNEDLYSNISYGASKAAIEQITRYYAKLYGPDIRVNSVAPGGIWQDHSEDFVSKYSRNIAMKRMANVEEIANVILFLLSPISSYITGQNIKVDGGFGL